MSALLTGNSRRASSSTLRGPRKIAFPVSPSWSSFGRARRLSKHIEHELFQFLHQHLGVAAALVVFLAARGRQIVRRAFRKPAFRLKIRECLRRKREQLAQAGLARPGLDELNQLPADALVFV